MTRHEHTHAAHGIPGELRDVGATIARRTLLGALGVATIGGLTAGAFGLTGRGAAPAQAGTV